MYYDLFDKMLQEKHILIAGTTGSGKSVIENNLIYHAIQHKPTEIQLILIDPKRVELIDYKRLPHTIAYASEPDTMINAINQAMKICNLRYQIMQKHHAKKYQGSHIFIIIDEYADLMSICRKDVENTIQRLAQIGRAARVHLVACTQYVNQVINTKIRCNFDCRIGLHTATEADSKRIIERSGCESLPRYGQCYYSNADGIERWKVPYIDQNTINDILHKYRTKNPLKRFIQRYKGI